MKKISLLSSLVIATVVSLTSLISCSIHTKDVIVQVPQPAPPIKGWSLTVPTDWIQKAQSEPTELYETKRVILGHKSIGPNKDERAVLIVISGIVGSTGEKDFPFSILEMEKNRLNTSVYMTRSVKLGNTVGLEIFELRMLDADNETDPPETIRVLMTAGASHGKGVLVLCGGNVKNSAEFSQECVEIVESLKLN